MENNVGLKNINSICYLNVLIQSVLSCDVFVNAIKTNKDKYMNETNVIGLLFYNIIYKMEHEIDIGIDNFTMSKKLEFVGQNCSHEALIFIIDKLHFEKIFDIKYEITIFCTNCDEITQKKIDTCAMYEYFTKSNDGDFISIINRQIDSDCEYKCDICNQKKHVFLHDLISSSEIFVITFNQFGEKKQIIKYENVITLSTGRYKLVAKINHIGNTNSGHYWMVRYNNKKTIAINDMEIKEINEINDDTNSTYTYMLFYIKINN